MTLSDVASKLMHASSFAARFTKGCAHQADIVRLCQNCESLRSSPPILPPAMIALESRTMWGGIWYADDILESGMSVRLFVIHNVYDTRSGTYQGP